MNRFSRFRGARGVCYQRGGQRVRLRVPESPGAGQLVIGLPAEAAVEELAEVIKIK
jgi:hypothetical protein